MLTRQDVSADRVYSVKLVNRELISILFKVGIYVGGAHPTTYFRALNYDRNAGRVLALHDLFKPNTRYLEVISDYCIESLDMADTFFIKASVENYRSWNITEKGIQIAFDRAQAGRAQEVLVPYSVLRDEINPRGPIASLAGPRSRMKK
jgi:hypothetical protein